MGIFHSFAVSVAPDSQRCATQHKHPGKRAALSIYVYWPQSAQPTARARALVHVFNVLFAVLVKEFLLSQ